MRWAEIIEDIADDHRRAQARRMKPRSAYQRQAEWEELRAAHLATGGDEADLPKPPISTLNS